MTEKYEYKTVQISHNCLGLYPKQIEESMKEFKEAGWLLLRAHKTEESTSYCGHSTFQDCTTLRFFREL